MSGKSKAELRAQAGRLRALAGGLRYKAYSQENPADGQCDRDIAKMMEAEAREIEKKIKED